MSHHESWNSRYHETSRKIRVKVSSIVFFECNESIFSNEYNEDILGFFLGIFQRFSRCRLFEMKKLLFSVLSKIFLVIFVVYKNRRSINRKSVVRVNGS